MIRSLAAAALLCLGLAASPAHAETPMWVIRDADSTIYLFGTSHVVKPDTKWRSAAFERAFAESEELWIEAEGAIDPAVAGVALGKYGADPAKSLSSKLDEPTRARLAVVAAEAGLAPHLLEIMRPWLVSMMLAVAPLGKAGYAAEAGVDVTLEAEAKKLGKPIRAFESPEIQARLLAGLPEAVQIANLKETLREFDQLGPIYEATIQAWLDGDVALLERLVMEEMAEEPAEYTEALLARRNAAWAETLAERLKGKGTSFVAVGAAHLVGPDSVQKMLEKKGVKAERVDTAD